MLSQSEGSLLAWPGLLSLIAKETPINAARQKAGVIRLSTRALSSLHDFSQNLAAGIHVFPKSGSGVR